MAITLLHVAEARGVKADADGCVNGAEFARVGVPMIGGCESCGATVAAYNAYPSRSGFIRCEDCVGGAGFEDVAEFEDFSRDGAE
jgi:hypothetical protein